MTLILAVFATAFVMSFSFVAGYKIGKGQEIKAPLPKFKGKGKVVYSDDVANQILANIERYDGTNKGQKEVIK